MVKSSWGNWARRDIDSGVSVVRYKAFCLGLGQTYSTGTNRKARPVSDDTGE